MNSEWQLWANDSTVLDKSTCAEIVEMAMQIPPKNGTIRAGEADDKIRRCDVRWLKWSMQQFAPVRELLQHRFALANRNAFGVDINYLPALQFTTYTAGDEGFYDWHIDTFWSSHTRPQKQQMTHRKLSCVIQLSDPESYEGGAFEMEATPPPPAEEFKRQGAMLIFPSFLRHRVTPVTRGVRHSLVAWMEGPFWR